MCEKLPCCCYTNRSMQHVYLKTQYAKSDPARYLLWPESCHALVSVDRGPWHMSPWDLRSPHEVVTPLVPPRAARGIPTSQQVSVAVELEQHKWNVIQDGVKSFMKIPVYGIFPVTPRGFLKTTAERSGSAGSGALHDQPRLI